MARDPRGTNITKKKDQAWARDPKEVEESWESKADSNRREWDPRYRYQTGMGWCAGHINTVGTGLEIVQPIGEGTNW